MQPNFLITVNGTNITSLIQDRFISLNITDEAGIKSDRFEFTIDDRDKRLDIPKTGAKVTVAIGYGANLVIKGTYVVDEVQIEGALRKMTIRASASDFTKTGKAAKLKAPRERSWHDTTIGAIVKKIAGESGLKPAISPSLAATKIEHEDQTESDMQFLSRLARDNGATMKVADGNLVFAEHGEGVSVSGKKLPTVKITATETTDWNIVIAERGAYGAIKASYHNRKTGKRRSVTIGKPSGGHVMTMNGTHQNRGKASRAAKSRKKAQDRGKTKFSISNMPGNPYLAAEQHMDAIGFRQGVDGIWMVNHVEHKIDDSGYKCSIQAEKPGTGVKKTSKKRRRRRKRSS